ncbi:MAG: hypothetical protein IIA59_02455 [Candidatus Marinimicrobia bacterium]|nr:hypothetical protein [Candidatus Neomarinimicrobiota bacterium]
MLRFSQRKKLTPVKEVIQIDDMDDDLRNSLWNALDEILWSHQFYLSRYGAEPRIWFVGKILWDEFFKLPIDELPDTGSLILDLIREHFYQCDWAEVYDFLEAMLSIESKNYSLLEPRLNRALQRELSGYRIVAGVVTDITDPQELESLQEVIDDTRFSAVSDHFKTALELMSKRDDPDYPNSIKESISAVEGMCRIITGKPRATLGEALKALDSDTQIHPALKKGWGYLYGFTSDEGGIRHAKMGNSSIGPAEAKYFLLSCSSFVNYLKAKM